MSEKYPVIVQKHAKRFFHTLKSFHQCSNRLMASHNFKNVSPGYVDKYLLEKNKIKKNRTESQGDEPEPRK